MLDPSGELAQLRAELALLRFRFALLVEDSADAFYLKDADGCYVYINEAGAAMMFHRPEQLIGHDDVGLFSPEVVAEIRGDDLHVIRTGQTAVIRTARAMTDGTRLDYLTVKRPWFDADGTVVGVVGTTQDMTPQAEAQRATAGTSEAFRGLVQAASNLILVHRGGVVLHANPAALAVLGGRPGAFVGSSATELVHADHRDALRKLLAGGRSHVDTAFIRADGELVFLELRDLPATWDGEAARVLIGAPGVHGAAPGHWSDASDATAPVSEALTNGPMAPDVQAALDRAAVLAGSRLRERKSGLGGRGGAHPDVDAERRLVQVLIDAPAHAPRPSPAGKPGRVTMSTSVSNDAGGRPWASCSIVVEPAPRSSVISPAPSQDRRPRLLLVDDERLISDLLVDGLAGSFEVVAADGVQAALALVTTSPPFDLVLCDLIMPGGGGQRLFEALDERGIRPAMLFMSGGAATPEARNFIERERIVPIEKPFRLGDVRRLLLGALAGRTIPPE